MMKNKKVFVSEGSGVIGRELINLLLNEEANILVGDLKPCPTEFKNKIKSIENCDWEDLVYIGDNPNKDFVSLNKVNAKTIRIKKGNYSHIVLSKDFEARYTITSLDNLDLLLQRIF